VAEFQSLHLRANRIEDRAFRARQRGVARRYGRGGAEVPVLAVYPDNRQIAAKVRAFVDFLARRLPSAALIVGARTPGVND
jgi:hypothetical protein